MVDTVQLDTVDVSIGRGAGMVGPKDGGTLGRTLRLSLWGRQEAATPVPSARLPPEHRVAPLSVSLDAQVFGPSSVSSHEGEWSAPLVRRGGVRREAPPLTNPVAARARERRAQTGDETTRARPNTSSVEISHDAVGATHHEIRQPLNWPLLGSVLACLCFWAAVIFGIVAVV